MVYPNRTKASGVWKLKNLASLISDGEYPDAGTRSIVGGGATPSNTNRIEFQTISTTGNGTDFGDLLGALQAFGFASNKTRGVFGGGVNNPSAPGNTNVEQYITFSSQGNTADFGDLSQTRRDVHGTSNKTRGVFCGGNTGTYPSFSSTDTMDFIEMATLGNATDFGNLSVSRADTATFASPLRGYNACGATAPTQSNVIDVINFSTTGNAADFGDASETKAYMGGCSDSTRGVFGGGENPSATNTLEKVEMSSASNSVNFGDLNLTALRGNNMSNSIRGLFTNKGGNNSIDFITIQSASNATDFGDLAVASSGSANGSDGHGGLAEIVRPGLDHLRNVGLALGGGTPSAVNTVESFNLASASNGVDFGDLTATTTQAGGASDHIRALAMSGNKGGSIVNNIDIILFDSKGNAADFGDTTSARQRGGGLSNSTRSIYGGGHTPTRTDIIDFVTTATTGNSTDFGDIASATTQIAGISSTTRGVFGGGNTGSAINVMQYITIASTGDATDFGDLTAARAGPGATGSDTRGLFGGAYPVSNVIDFITIASTGDATDFGDLTQARNGATGGSLSNRTKGLFAGGYIYPASPAVSNVIDSVTIASTGNAVDHGDLTAGRQNLTTASNGHGGL